MAAGSRARPAPTLSCRVHMQLRGLVYHIMELAAFSSPCRHVQLTGLCQVSVEWGWCDTSGIGRPCAWYMADKARSTGKGAENRGRGSVPLGESAGLILTHLLKGWPPLT